MKNALIFVHQFTVKKRNTMKNLVFGWVSANIQQNFAAWSTWKSQGDETDANVFFEQTRDEAEKQGLEWFCVDSE